MVVKPRHPSVTNWFETPLGRHVLQAETRLAREALEDVFGFDLLQIGHWGRERFLLDAVRTQHATLVAEDSQLGVSLNAQLSALPFASDSIDAVLLPHTLELVDDPYAVLREAERILRPEGTLMICGFNPWSGWGLRRTLARAVGGPEFPPNIQRMISEMRLRDWVALLGLDVDKVMGYLGLIAWAGAGVPPPEHVTRPSIMSGAYFLKAHKRVQTLTMLRPKWRTRSRIRVGAAEPTTRVRG